MLCADCSTYAIHLGASEAYIMGCLAREAMMPVAGNAMQGIEPDYRPASAFWIRGRMPRLAHMTLYLVRIE